MNSLAKQFYEKGSDANFQEIIFLSEMRREEWDDLSEKVPDLPRSWFELSRIAAEERVEFLRDLWLDLLPYQPSVHKALAEWFASLDDIALLIVKKEGQWQPEMVYSLADNSTFFCGLPPASEEDLRELLFEMGVSSLPRDYLSFLQIHSGFGKLSELGLLKIEEISAARGRVKNLLLTGEKPILLQGRVVDPESLIPFYEAYGLSSFQCFYADWYPGSEMGNVYLSGIDYTISEIRERKNWAESLAYPTFLEWLVDYLEGMNTQGT